MSTKIKIPVDITAPQGYRILTNPHDTVKDGDLVLSYCRGTVTHWQKAIALVGQTVAYCARTDNPGAWYVCRRGVPPKPRIPEFLEWTVKIRVYKDWVADGFDLSEPCRRDSLLDSALPYAPGAERRVTIITKPPRALIRKIQGYKK